MQAKNRTGSFGKVEIAGNNVKHRQTNRVYVTGFYSPMVVEIIICALSLSVVPP